MKNEIPKFGMRDKIGYMFGDFGNDFTFIMASSFLMVFYTKVLGISGAAVGTLFLLARFADAFADLTMGQIVDRSKTRKNGKFRPWILRMCGPVALTSFLMYQAAMVNAPMNLRIVYMYVTYILWGTIFYTAINIPYGSMAAALTSDPQERTSLSMFRTIGSTLASMVIGVITPIFIYTKDAAGNQVVRGGSTFTIVAGVFSICAVLCYFLCYKLTTERVKVVSENKVQLSPVKRILAALKNKGLIAIIGAAIFLLLSQLLIVSMVNYVYPDVYNDASGIMISNLISPILILFVVAPLTTKFSKKFGKKEVAMVMSFFAAIVFFILYILRTDNMYVFITLMAIGFMGIGAFNTVIWANITDIIDDQEVKTHEREDGTIYSIYSFARKVGQALAGGIGGWALSIIGYNSLADVQTPKVLHGLYTTATLIPAICFVVVGIILIFYPLSKTRVLENAKILQDRKNK